MAKKKKGGKIKKRALSPEEAQQLNEKKLKQANEQFTIGAYKEALQLYKAVWKNEQTDEIRQALIKCYLLRAKELAEKRMFQEACILWESRNHLMSDNADIDLYISWLINSKRPEKAINLFEKNSQALKSSPHYNTLLAELALYSLIQSKKISTLQEEINKANTILSLLDSDTESTHIEKELRKISLRSPFKDLRITLQAIALRCSEHLSDKAIRQLIAKISPSSYYYSIVEVIRISLSHGIELISEMANLANNQKQLLSILKCWNVDQLKQVEKLSQVYSQTNNKKQLSFILSASSELNNENVKNICISALAHTSINLNEIAKQISLPEFNVHQVQALRAERKHEPGQAFLHWEKATKSITKKRSLSDEEKIQLGLIKLKQFDLLATIDIDYESNSVAYYIEDIDDVDYLIESLKYLPNKLETYQKICQWYKEEKEQKKYRDYLQKAIQAFPNNTNLLYEYAEDCYERKAYKKAGDLAKKILKLDSINFKAKSLNYLCSIASVRKQIKAQKLDKAISELKNAPSAQKSEQPYNLKEILLHNIDYLGGDQKALVNLIDTPCKSSTNLNVLVSLVELNAAAKSKKDLPDLFALIESTKKVKLMISNMDNLLNLISQLVVYAKKHKLLKELSSVLIDSWGKIYRSTPIDTNIDKYLSLCEALAELNCFSPLKKISVAALKQHTKSPALHYYKIYAEHKGRGHHLSEHEFEKLEHALDEAKSNNNRQLSIKIIELLDQASIFHMGIPPELARIFGRMA